MDCKSDMWFNRNTSTDKSFVLILLLFRHQYSLSASHSFIFFPGKDRHKKPQFVTNSFSFELLTIDERGSTIDRNSVSDCHLSPVGRQMAIENSFSNYF